VPDGETARDQHPSQSHDYGLLIVEQKHGWPRLRHDQFPSSWTRTTSPQRVLLLF